MRFARQGVARSANVGKNRSWYAGVQPAKHLRAPIPIQQSLRIPAGSMMRHLRLCFRTCVCKPLVDLIQL
jgi:hypothetical protein